MASGYGEIFYKFLNLRYFFCSKLIEILYSGEENYNNTTQIISF
jgi:hypothetical protein